MLGTPQEMAEERERLAKAKELEVARLRAMQEKVQDTRSAEDEARAKRYQVGAAAGRDKRAGRRFAAGLGAGELCRMLQLRTY